MTGRKTVLVIGAGGIGSYLIPLIDRVELYDITVADPDIIETKNLLYQNYDVIDVGNNKAKTMGEKYNSVVTSSPYAILTEQQVLGYDLVVACVDNLQLRKMLYRTGVDWLDLRAQGRNCMLLSSKVTGVELEEMLIGDDSRTFSCQGDSWVGDKEGVQFMQAVVAGLGAQWIQRYFGENEVEDFKMVSL